jgi:two-component sensor histidine kinase
LITNSIKHAFIKKKSGNINITIKSKNPGEFLFTYFDNGEWKEPKNKNPSFGIELIEILTSQLEGNYKRISNEEGTTYTFHIKNIDVKE